MAASVSSERVDARARVQLAVAACGVMLAAADTYVVVLALLPILSSLQIAVTNLQKATPIISGFLLGYVAMMPLLGRLSDVYGRRPVFIACLGAFLGGSIVTATAGTLGGVVTGRCIQGLGGGGMVPVTLALVGDHWPAGRRGVPLGIIGAVQELGSVLGPLYGAAVISTWDWRAVFWINVPVSIVLGAALMALGDARPGPSRARSGWFDLPGLALWLAALGGGVLALLAPEALVTSDAWGGLYTPSFGDHAPWLTPLVIGTGGLVLAALAWETLQPLGVRPLLSPRRLPSLLRSADWVGAVLLAGVLGCVVISFSAADPTRQVVADGAPWLLGFGAVLLVLFAVRERSARDPLIALGELRDRAAFGSLAANFAVGGALMAALVDIPVFALSTYTDSQVSAALVLVRLLVGVPIGALIGGAICERLTYRGTTAFGMLLSAGMFLLMARWDEHTLGHSPGASDLELFACGLGFGLVIAPINAALLASVRASMHGLASALVVVARTMGMLVGLSLLTAVGLRTFDAQLAAIPPPTALCPTSPLRCQRYFDLTNQAVVAELHVVFVGAALCALLAAALGAGLLRGRRAQPPAHADHGATLAA